MSGKKERPSENSGSAKRYLRRKRGEAISALVQATKQGAIAAGNFEAITMSFSEAEHWVGSVVKRLAGLSTPPTRKLIARVESRASRFSPPQMQSANTIDVMCLDLHQRVEIMCEVATTLRTHLRILNFAFDKRNRDGRGSLASGDDFKAVFAAAHAERARKTGEPITATEFLLLAILANVEAPTRDQEDHHRRADVWRKRMPKVREAVRFLDQSAPTLPDDAWSVSAVLKHVGTRKSGMAQHKRRRCIPAE